MNPFIYLPDNQKESYIQRTNSFVNTYLERLAVQFNNLEKEAEDATEQRYQELGAYFDPERHDPSDFAEDARDFGIDYWQSLILMKYNTYMMTLATLYQVWEQQIRGLAFREITRHHKLIGKDRKELQFKNFCTNFPDLEELFQQSDWTPASITSWGTINELRLVQNVIKHGDGSAAKQLYEVQPSFFKKVSSTLIMDLYGTTLNEIALSIPDTEIERYRDALIEFWEEMPERVHFTITEAPLLVEGPITLKEEAGTGVWAHYVQQHRLISGCIIQVRFNKKHWITGVYNWSGKSTDLPELHSKNKSDVLIFCMNHLVKLEVEVSKSTP